MRHVFFVSDGTGITAETLGSALMTQFDGLPTRTQTLPFITTADKAERTVAYINHLGDASGHRPIVFSTTANEATRAVLATAKAYFVDLFDQMVPGLEEELGQRSTHAQGRAHSMGNQHRYNDRIAAINFSLEHDDGQSSRDLCQAQVILIAPSRCGKTPTALYMALQYGIFATNYPLLPEDLDELKLPGLLQSHRDKLYGLVSEPERLSQVRNERRPGSRYASLAQCVFELRQAEAMFNRLGIPYLNSATMSIEEIAATVMQARGLRGTSA